MTGFVVCLMLLLAIAGHSDAAYCVCNAGLSTSVLQKNIDYACGAGADCSAITQNGACFNPNTVLDHCNYAVNSYYQRKGQAVGSCDFAGTATVSQTPPSVTTGCVYQSSPSNVGSTTPTSPTIGGTPTTPTIGGTPNTGGTTIIPNTGGTTTTGTMPNSITPPGVTGVGMGPTGSGFGSTDNTAGATHLSLSPALLLISSFTVALLVSGLRCPRI